MKINMLPVTQDGNTFYVGKMKAKDLVRIATTKARKSKTNQDYNDYLKEVDDIIKDKINNGDVWYLKGLIKDSDVQREQSESRLKEIGTYISKANALFPNSIIINLSLKYEDDDQRSLEQFVTIKDNEIEFDENNVTATIIDGQHRLGGFNYTSDQDYFLENFELIITIMVGLTPAQQADLFATINGKQKPVNKSVLYDLSAMSEEEYTEQVTAHLIVSWFNVNGKSPLKGMIKMLGTGDGTISQAAIIDSIIPLIKKKRLNTAQSIEKNTLIPVFHKEFVRKESKIIIKNLYTYFKCISNIFEEEWNYANNRGDKVKYILNKTTGIGGLLIAYPTIYAYQYYLGDYSYETLYRLINRLKEEEFEFTSDVYSGGSKQLQKKLGNDILTKLFEHNDIIMYRNKFIEDNWEL